MTNNLNKTRHLKIPNIPCINLDVKGGGK